MDHIPNKYLAVNVASQRARALNERALPVTDAARYATKPTTQALIELTEGCLTYYVTPLPSMLADNEVDFDDLDDDVGELFEDLASDDDFVAFEDLDESD